MAETVNQFAIQCPARMPIADILQARQFDQLVGMVEGPDLEVKGEPYDLNSAAERYELVKDVAAFANAQGGYLLIGCTTERRQETTVDVINRLALIHVGQFNVGQYEGIIRDYLHPQIDGLSVEFCAATDATAGLGVIFVPPQVDDRKPFLTARVVECGELLKEIIVSYSQRTDDDNVSLLIRDLHQAFRKGRDSDSQRLTRMEEKLDQLILGPAAASPAPSTIDRGALEGRIDAIFQDAEE